MREFQERRRLKKIFLSRPVFFLLAVLVFLSSASVYKVYKKSREAVLRNRAVENELSELEKKRDELGANIRWLQTEEGKEEELRKKFQVGKEGEEYMVIIDQESRVASQSQQPAEEDFFKKTWNIIKDIF